MRTYEEFRRLFPKIYVECVEVNTFSFAQYAMLQFLNNQYLQLHNNQYILLAGSDGLAEYEKILNIPIDLSEDIEFRRERILARLVTLPPFTMNYLRKRLDEFIGEGAWDAYIDFDNYTLYIQSYIIQKWYHEFQVMMNMIKPANIVFINTPIVGTHINLPAEARMAVVDWQYRLGQWAIDEVTPFALYDEGEIINMATEPSVTTFALNKAANDFISQITHAVLTGDGNTFVQRVFDVKRADANVGVLRYRVYPENIQHIEHISLQDFNNNVILEFDTDLTILVDNIVIHAIDFREVLDDDL